MKLCVQSNNRGGFVLPAVLFTLVILSAVALGVLLTAGDERNTANGFRASGRAMYAAEAGLNELLGTWDDSLVTGLAPGDSVILAPKNLLDGSTYTARIQRWDNGGQGVYSVTIEADAPGSLGGSALNVILSQSGMRGSLKMGDCCDALATVFGLVELNDDTFLDGSDTPPPSWSANGMCGGPSNDKPGLIVNDINNLDLNHDTYIDGTPAVVEDIGLGEQTFDNYGGLSWQQVKDLRTTTIGTPGDQERYRWGGDPATGDPSDYFGPRYIGSSCDTSAPLNFGSPDPTSDCYDFFPIILAQGEIEIINGGYMQGIVILEENPDGTGSEFELYSNVVFAGIIIGKGCVEIEAGAMFYGAIFVDGTFTQLSCGGDEPLKLNDDAFGYYSDCVVQRVLRETGIGAATTGDGDVVAAAQRILARSFTQLMRQ